MYTVVDTSLGCLDDDLKPDSEPQKIIDLVQVLQDCIYKTEVQQSFWKFVNTPTLREFVRASDYFTEWVLFTTDKTTFDLDSSTPIQHTVR